MPALLSYVALFLFVTIFLFLGIFNHTDTSFNKKKPHYGESLNSGLVCMCLTANLDFPDFDRIQSFTRVLSTSDFNFGESILPHEIHV